ncbi:MAG: RAMP superfamily CRISPR-associated protein [candidate division WOR-3 bacterium]
MGRLTKIECTVRFVTPAFLGGADQSAQWRTPPFKALIRQWWRVAECAGQKPNTSLLHEREGELFGRATDKGTTASHVRLRLSDWRGGEISKSLWKPNVGTVKHPEVQKPPQIGADLYLGFGPLEAGGLKRESAIEPGQIRRLLLGFPEQEAARFSTVMCLVHLLGAIGSRCRNGWGSLDFDQGGLSKEQLASILQPDNTAAREWLRAMARPWQKALDTDWCHAIGLSNDDDKRLLLWRTEKPQPWQDVLRVLANVKIAYRTQFHFQGGGQHNNLCDRQVLAYPVTRHTLGAWGQDQRSANQILFKVLPEPKGYVGIVAHMPHGLPRLLAARLNEKDRANLTTRETEVWKQVHAVLDKKLIRLP